MEIVRITPEDFTVTRWGGGSTAQIAIAPEGAVYAERDFLWRLSSATVELEESDFTALPDYWRYLSTLQGTVRVSHDGGEEIELAPFAVHSFDGGAETKSRGTCRDFNLMLRKGKCRGTLLALRLGEGTEASLPRTLPGARGARTLAVYCARGGGILRALDADVRIGEGEALLVREPPETVRFRSETGSGLMVAEIVPSKTSKT